MRVRAGIWIFFIFFCILFVPVAYSFTASGGDIEVKSTTMGGQGGLLSGADIGARFLLSIYQPGAFAVGTGTSANIGFFEFPDVCFPFGECGYFFDQVLYCDEGTWKSPNLEKAFCIAPNCEFVWMDGVISGTQCCGNDGLDDNSYYANASLTDSRYVLCQRCDEGVFATNTTLIGNGVLVGSGSERECFHGNIVCNVNQALNGTSSSVYGWGYLDGQTCYYGNASCSNGAYSNSTNCQLPCEGEWCCVNQVNYTDMQSCHETEGCLFTDHDRNDAQSYCEASGNGCEPFVWFSGLSTCCGNDDADDSFDDPGTGNHCCFEGNFIEHNSSYEYMLCWNGELYDCNNQASLGFEINVANCEEANSSGWYCAASGEPTYWQRGFPLGCEGCDFNEDCAFGYCDSELEYGLTIDPFVCFNCTACEGFSNVACGDHNASRCQYDCGSSEDCDDVEPTTCRDGTSIYCDLGCIARDRNTAEEYCTTDINNCEPFVWINGGELDPFGAYDPGTSLACCGSDQGEYFRNTSLMGTYYAACCSSPLSCVNQSSLCVKTGIVQGEYTCSNGEWNKIPEHDSPRIHIRSRIDNNVVGYWTLDNDVSDISGNGNHGTNNGATNIRQGYAAGAFEFDGSSYVNLNYGSGLNPSTHPHSFSMWVKAGSTASNRMFMSAGQSGGSDNRFYIGINSGNWDMGIRTSPWGSGTISATSEWTHIAVTMNGSRATLYVNGNIGRTINYDSYSFNRHIYLGNHDDNYYWVGKIDEVTIFNRTLSETEIKELHNGTAYTRNSLTCAPVNVSDSEGANLTYIFNWYRNGDSLTVLNMPFDSNVSVAQADAIKDYSDSENHGTLGGGNQSYAPAYRSGDDCVSGGCYEFDGSDDFIDLPNDLGYISEFSAFAWFKSGGTPAGNFHIVLGGQQLEISIPTSGELRTGVSTTNGRFFSNHGSGLTDGSWHFIGFTFNGTNKKSFIDGQDVGDLPVTGTLTYSFSNRRIGRFGSSSTYYLNGFVDEIMIFNTTLTPDQVSAIYEAGENSHQPDIIDYSMTTKHDEWKCDLAVNDGHGDSMRLFSENLTIRNTPPVMGSLLLPANETSTTNRKPTFEWEPGTDDDGDSLTYSIEIRREGACSLPDYCSVPVITDSGISGLSYTPVQNLDIATYAWNVTAHDGEEYGEASETFEVTVQSLVNITLVNSTIDFSVLPPMTVQDTADNSPYPFRIKNDGNIRVDILMNSSQLFLARSLNTSYFQAKAREIFAESFDTGLSKMNWFNLSEALALVISDLEFASGSDEAYIDIRVDVPPDEPPGEKEALLIFEGESS
jgi:hypothetical protein